MLRGRLLAALIGSALVLSSLAACGSDSSAEATKQPSKATKACRAQWHQLGQDIAPQVALTQRSALPERWNSVAATIDYYDTSATSDDCGDRLDAQQKAIASLKAFSARLVTYDMQAQLAAVQDAAQAYATGPWPPAPTPTPTPGTKHQKKKHPAKKPPRPPRPALVAAALKSLIAQAPIATQQQGPGWQQASVVDLNDTAATAKTVKDLAFLSTESSGWRSSQLSLKLIKTALAAKTG